MSKRLERLKETAYREALKSTGIQRHGAIVLGNGGRVLAKACNNYDNGCHAEVRALKRIPHDAKECAVAIIVVRARRNQRFGLSRPCVACQAALKAANIDIVYYSTNNETLEYEIFHEDEYRSVFINDN